jgi:alkyl hydroperoxide reductase subunit AhpC
MIELGQLERHHDDFDTRRTQIIVASTEKTAEAKQTQADFPHLLVLADSEHGLINALGIMDPRLSPATGDSAWQPRQRSWWIKTDWFAGFFDPAA